jgi:general secretion pathway protein G
LAPWVLGLGVAAMVLTVPVVVVEFQPMTNAPRMSLSLALLAAATGLAAIVLGDRAMRDRRYRKGMVLTGGLMGVCAFLLVGPFLALYVAAGGPGVGVARRNGTIANIGDLSKAVEKFKADNGRYPETSEGLEALLVAPAGLEGTWKGPYIEGGKVPCDAWGRDFLYRFPGEAKATDFDIISAGADGVPGTADDIDRHKAK